MTKRLSPPKRLIDIHNHLWAEGGEEEFLARMDRFGIELTLLLGLPDEPRGNRRVLAAVRRHGGKFLGGCFLDPRRGRRAVAELKHWHAEGFHVVKLFPNYGYWPDDDAFRPFFDALAERNMAVLTHCGWLAAGPRVECAAYYSHPGRFEKLLRVYPDTPFIFAHMGGIAGFLETVMLTTRAPNAFTDPSPGQGTWVLESAGAMAASVPPAKLIWGADSTNIAEVLRRHVAALGKLGYGPHLDEVFYSNARCLLEKVGALPAKNTKHQAARNKQQAPGSRHRPASKPV